jgi:RNA polymerase sigma factor (sigma-70 family)
MNDIDDIRNDSNIFDKPETPEPKPEEALDASDLAAAQAAASKLDWVDKELRRIRGIPLLADGEDVILHRRWRDGDQDAGDRLLNAHSQQALTAAYRRCRAEGAPMHLMHLLSAGCLALAEARETFNPDSGHSFSTYVWKILERSILQEAIHLSNVTTPEAKRIKIAKGSPNYRHINVERFTDRDGSERDVSYDDMLGSRRAYTTDEDKEDDLGTPADKGSAPCDDALEIENLYRRVLDEAIAEIVLTERELLIYSARHRWPTPTYKELGFELGRSGEWVRQMEKLAIEKVEAARGTDIDTARLRMAMARFYASFHFITAKSFELMLDDGNGRRFPKAEHQDRKLAHRAADKILVAELRARA